jgi:transposase-like protein
MKRPSDAELSKKHRQFLKIESDTPDQSCGTVAAQVGVARGTIFRWRKKIAAERGQIESTHTVCVDLTAHQAEQFADHCRKNGVRMSEQLREMVLELLSKEKTRTRRS